MHELYIAQSILSTVVKSLPEGLPPERVTLVHIEVGQLDAVVDRDLKKIGKYTYQLVPMDHQKVHHHPARAAVRRQGVSRARVAALVS